MENMERVYARIDLDALTENINEMNRSLQGGAPIMAVIKTNAYGHGAVAVARLLEKNDDICGYAVATAEEALQLRREGIRKKILILGYVFPKDYEALVQEEIRLCVFRYDMAEEISQAARKLKKTAYLHIKIDTGMHRIGFPASKEAVDEIAKIATLPFLSLEGVFTHFARADEADKTHACQQFQQFLNMLSGLTKAGVSFPIRHCSNSASIMELPRMHLDMVRAGIILYGLWPSDEMKRDFQLHPVLSLYSHIVHLKTLPAGSAVSYGGTYVTNTPRRIATVPVGYGDGYPRSLSNKGYVLVRGRKAPIVGRICMDQFMIDVTEIPKTSLYDVVTLIGREGDGEITMETLGALSGRFNYELACDLGNRIPRYYYHNGKKIDEFSFFA